MSTPKKALIFAGETGLLGQEIVSTLKEQNWDTISLGRKNGDIFNKVFLEKAIEEFSPDIVFNTIAYTQVDKAEEERELAYKLNRDFPQMLGKILQPLDTKLVHYSTDFVFDGKASQAYKEDDKTNPLSMYGITKLAGENAIRESGLSQHLIIRTAWLFGPRKRNFVSFILKKARELEAAKSTDKLKIVCDQIGSPSYTADLVTNSLALIKAQANGVFHLTNSGIASWFELAQEAIHIADIHLQALPIKSFDYSQAAQRPAFSVLSNAKFTETTGITPRSWTQALRDYIYSKSFQI